MNPITNSDIQQQLKKLSEEWTAAERQGDAAFFERTLTDDFVGVGPLGFMLSKTDTVQRFMPGKLKYESFMWDEEQVRVYGDSAVIIGRQTQKAKYQEQVMEGKFRTTLIWVQQQDRWLLAGFHISPIAERP